MAPTHELCHLKCELSIIRWRNLDLDPSADVFLRCHVPIGGGKRIRVDSPARCGELTVLACQGDADDMMSSLLERCSSVVVELRRRRRSTATVLARLMGSELMGATSIAWKDLLEPAGVPTERWVTISRRSGGPDDGQEPPAVLLGMKARVSRKTMKPRHRVVCDCSCRHCEWNLEDEDMFALAAAVGSTR